MQDTLRFERIFDATPEEMWSAWTDPKEFARWYDPTGGDLVVREFDVRPGGRYRYETSRAGGSAVAASGVFHEVEPYARLVCGAVDRSFLIDVRIEPHGASRCHAAVHVTGAAALHARAGAEWSRTLDRLEMRLAENTPIRGQAWSMEREFDATPEEVWEALTTREIYARWISPFKADAEIHEFDPRPGGRARFTMIGDKGERYPEASFLFLVMDRPREIVFFEANRDRADVFDANPMRERITLTPLPGGRTRVLLEQEGLPATFPVEMARQGFTICFEKLARVLAGGDAGGVGSWGEG